MLRSLASLEAEWQPYSQGAEAYAHGLALPTANSLRGSVVADENVLAVRSLTLPPLPPKANRPPGKYRSAGGPRNKFVSKTVYVPKFGGRT